MSRYCNNNKVKKGPEPFIKSLEHRLAFIAVSVPKVASKSLLTKQTTQKTDIKLKARVPT
jgi:hypothetical protein